MENLDKQHPEQQPESPVRDFERLAIGSGVFGRFFDHSPSPLQQSVRPSNLTIDIGDSKINGPPMGFTTDQPASPIRSAGGLTFDSNAFGGFFGNDRPTPTPTSAGHRAEEILARVEELNATAQWQIFIKLGKELGYKLDAEELDIVMMGCGVGEMSREALLRDLRA